MSPTAALAQISQGGLAPSLDRSTWTSPLTAPPTVRLAPIDVQPYLDEDAVNNVYKDHKYRFGVEVPTAIEPSAHGVWDQLADGSWVWRAEIYSADALSLNLIFDRFVVPPGARLFLHTPHGEQLGAFTDFNMQASETLATMVTSGDSVIVEYHEPANAAFPGDVRVGTVVHGYRDLWDKTTDKAFGSSGNCNINTVCSQTAGWEDQIRSVVMLVDGGGFCTGVLMNNTAEDGTPYILTANHCGGGVSSWVFVFNWESSTCPNPGTNAPQSDTVSGGVLRASRSASDFYLVEANNNIPAAYDPFYAGFDYTGSVPTSTVGIHHPSSDMKKWSEDLDPAVLTGYFGSGNDHWEVVDWDQGTTEGGSSGSPLFDQNGRVVGQLHGGSAACGNNFEDYYGAFHVSWDGGSSSSSRLREWLDPLGTDPGAIDGWDPNAPSVALDARVSQILEPVDGSTTCIDPSPLVRIQNRGTSTLTSADIEVSVNGGNWYLDQTWSGSLGTNATADLVLASISLNPGAHTIDVRTANPNNSSDDNPSNDLASVSFDMVDATGIAPPIFQDFEAAAFPGVGWTVINPDGGETWERNTDASGFGTGQASTRVNNFDNDFTGELDWLVSPVVDLASLQTAEVSFDYAYARYNSGYADRMLVYASEDCGGTWDVLFDQSSNGLSTTGSNVQSFFVPSNNQWESEVLDLTPYTGGPVSVAFVNESGWGNNLYVDNIGIDGTGTPDFDFDGDCSCATAPCSGSANPGCGPLVGGDCDDTDPNRSPTLPELTCDGIDNDCSASTDDQPDADGDGESACTDCDDTDPNRSNLLAEVTCDGIDNDCRPLSLDNPDNDGDGDGACTDCNDNDAAISSTAAEVYCDGLDNDCDPATADSIDGDGDGDPSCSDCNDADASVYTGAPEVTCDGIDNDCDPTTLDGPDNDGDGDPVCTDCDDTRPRIASTLPETPCDFLDNDCNPATPDSPDGDGDGDGVCTDCNDADPTVATTLTEVPCDGIDNDCSVVTPDALDADGDGYDECVDCQDAYPQVNPGMTEIQCDGLNNDCDGTTSDNPDADADGVRACDGDCDDADPAVLPGAAEIGCDGIDNDCDPGTLDGPDADADGDPACTDCDDTDPSVSSLLSEVSCDGLDNDCDPSTTDTPDGDGDGDSVCTDCDDTDPSVASTLSEVTCDGVDNDCDPATTDSPDLDGDGDDACVDCDDSNPSVGPSAIEILCDAIDNDCNAATPDEVDEDGDGFGTCTDCNDLDASSYPAAPELCDAVDNDCDGVIPNDELDLDGDGVSTCSGDCDDSSDLVFPGATELCDGLDNDCDGTLPGEEADTDGDGVSQCAGDCVDDDANIYPGALEACDGIDTDCDGQLGPDERDEDLDGLSTCDGDCNDAEALESPALPEDTEPDCTDGLDNDCDGLIDPLDPDCAPFYDTGTGPGTGGAGTGTGDFYDDDPLDAYQEELKGEAAGCACDGAGHAPVAPAMLMLLGLAARRR